MSNTAVIIISIFSSVVASFVFTFLKFWLNKKYRKIEIKDGNQTIVFDSTNVSEAINIILEKKASPQIFLSYSHADRDFAKKLSNDLKQHDVRVWFDESEIKLGDNILYKLKEAVNNSAYYGLILSPESGKSKWLKEELKLMYNKEIEEKRSKILPIIIGNSEVPELLKSRKYADFRNDYEEGLSVLLSKLTAK